MEERKKRETIRSWSRPMLKPTDTVQRAEAVGRPGCVLRLFLFLHISVVHRGSSARGERENEMTGGEEEKEKEREKQRDWTRLSQPAV